MAEIAPDSRKYSGVMLDFDGCMALSTIRGWGKSVLEVVPKWQAQGYLKDVTSHHCLNHIVHRLHNVEEYDIPPELVQDFVDDVIDDMNAKNIPLSTMYAPGIVEALQTLRENDIRTAVVTNSDEKSVRPHLEHLGLLSTGLIELFVNRDTLPRDPDGQPVTKPDPRPLQYVAEQFGLSPQEFLMVGDSSTDIKAANNAGATPVLFRPPGHHDIYPYRKVREGRANGTRFEHLVRNMDQVVDIALGHPLRVPEKPWLYNADGTHKAWVLR